MHDIVYRAKRSSSATTTIKGETNVAELITHNFEQVETIFQLFGNKENDITRAIAWTMKKCPSFLQLFIDKISGQNVKTDELTILYQQFEKTGKDNGYTDLEITDGKNVHIILEAKRGWILPQSAQLTKYAHRPSFVNSIASNKYIVTLSECSSDYANTHLPFKYTDNGIAVIHCSWKDLRDISIQARKNSNHEQKHLLEEFIAYIGGLMTMQNKISNRVYVVSIGNGRINDGTTLTWKDVVEKTGHYFCPFGTKGWPKDPPNYIAFRYNGKLQSIHHIDGYIITKNMHDAIPEMPDADWDDEHIIYNLGAAIIPQKEVRTGKGIYRNGRVWAALDLLLTCDTITEARDKTKERENMQSI